MREFRENAQKMVKRFTDVACIMPSLYPLTTAIVSRQSSVSILTQHDLTFQNFLIKLMKRFFMETS